MSVEMDGLKAAVAQEDSIITSAVTAFQGIAGQIADAAGDRTASLALSDDVNKQAQALAAAIPQNTPVTPQVAAQKKGK